MKTDRKMSVKKKAKPGKGKKSIDTLIKQTKNTKKKAIVLYYEELPKR